MAGTTGLAPLKVLRSIPRLAGMLFVGTFLFSPLASGHAASSFTPTSDVMKDGTETQGTFDLATVEELALFFAEESVRRLRIPFLLRLTLGRDGWNKNEEIEEIRRSPPRVDTHGAVYPLGDKNPLSFVFDSGTRSLSCWERIVKKRGSMGRLALTGPEMAKALNAATSRNRDRGGADFAYDPIRDAISLRLDYLHPPIDRERFYKDIDRLVATGLEWVEGRYLEKALPIVESRHPSPSATASNGEFAATLALRHFSAKSSESQTWVERYVRAWDRPFGGPAPFLVSDRELSIDQTLHAYIHFQGAARDAQGMAEIDAVFRLVAPDGTSVFSDLLVPIWRAPAPPRKHVQLGASSLSFVLDREHTAGTYRLEAEVCDRVADHCVRLSQAFALRPG